MTKRISMQKSVIERFSERARCEADGLSRIELSADAGPNHAHFRRFMKIVEARKQQILERVLLEEH